MGTEDALESLQGFGGDGAAPLDLSRSPRCSDRRLEGSQDGHRLVAARRQYRGRQAYLIKTDLLDVKKINVRLTAQDKVMSISGERRYEKMENRGTMMQASREAFSVLMREPFIAPTLLPVCCVCSLIRDDTRSSPGRELWVTQRTYHKTHAVNPSDLALTHTYCPTCFTEVQGTVRQDFQEIGTAP